MSLLKNVLLKHLIMTLHKENVLTVVLRRTYLISIHSLVLVVQQRLNLVKQLIFVNPLKESRPIQKPLI